MRAFGLALSALVFLSIGASAQASLVADGPSTENAHSPQISTDLNSTISMGNLVSKGMQWSQLELDSLKEDGLNAGLPYTYTAEMLVKSDLIRSFNVAQIEQTAPPRTGKYRSHVAILMFAAGFAMWVGLSFQRRY